MQPFDTRGYHCESNKDCLSGFHCEKVCVLTPQEPNDKDGGNQEHKSGQDTAPFESVEPEGSLDSSSESLSEARKQD